MPGFDAIRSRTELPQVLATADFVVLLLPLDERSRGLFGAEMLAALRFEQPGLRIVPEVFYRPAVALPRLRHRVTRAAAPAAVKKLQVNVQNAATGGPVAGVTVIGFTDFAERTDLLARLLANTPAVLTMARDANRADRRDPRPVRRLHDRLR